MTSVFISSTSDWQFFQLSCELKILELVKILLMLFSKDAK